MLVGLVSLSFALWSAALGSCIFYFSSGRVVDCACRLCIAKGVDGLFCFVFYSSTWHRESGILLFYAGTYFIRCGLENTKTWEKGGSKAAYHEAHGHKRHGERDSPPGNKHYYQEQKTKRMMEGSDKKDLVQLAFCVLDISTPSLVIQNTRSYPLRTSCQHANVRSETFLSIFSWIGMLWNIEVPPSYAAFYY